MAAHEFSGMDFDYVIEATRIEQLAGKYEYAAKLSSMVRRMAGGKSEPVNVLYVTGECWGETEDIAVKKAREAVEAWIRTQKSN